MPLVRNQTETHSSAISMTALSDIYGIIGQDSAGTVSQVVNTTTVASEEPPPMSHQNSSTTMKTIPLSHDSTDDAIFYNIYIDPASNTAKREFSLDIVKEQLQQILNVGRDRVVYYSLIGYNLPHTNDRFCLPGLKCVRLQYVESGFEEVTLQSLYGYCATHPTARVTYIHSKGTFNPSSVHNHQTTNQHTGGSVQRVSYISSK